MLHLRRLLLKIYFYLLLPLIVNGCTGVDFTAITEKTLPIENQDLEKNTRLTLQSAPTIDYSKPLKAADTVTPIRPPIASNTSISRNNQSTTQISFRNSDKLKEEVIISIGGAATPRQTPSSQSIVSKKLTDQQTFNEVTQGELSLKNIPLQKDIRKKIRESTNFKPASPAPAFRDFSPILPKNKAVDILFIIEGSPFIKYFLENINKSFKNFFSGFNQLDWRLMFIHSYHGNNRFFQPNMSDKKRNSFKN